MGVFSFIKSTRGMIDTSHPQAMLSNLRSVGVYYDHGKMNKRMLPMVVGLRNIIFPKVVCNDVWDQQEIDGAYRAFYDSFSLSAFRFFRFRRVVEAYQIENTVKVAEALRKLNTIDRTDWAFINTDVLNDVANQMQIVLDGPSKHYGWVPHDVMDVTATEVSPLMLK